VRGKCPLSVMVETLASRPNKVRTGHPIECWTESPKTLGRATRLRVNLEAKPKPGDSSYQRLRNRGQIICMIPFATETVAGAALSGVECRLTPHAQACPLFVRSADHARWKPLTQASGPGERPAKFEEIHSLQPATASEVVLRNSDASRLAN
jgi:hypothetical protein